MTESNPRPPEGPWKEVIPEGWEVYWRSGMKEKPWVDGLYCVWDTDPQNVWIIPCGNDLFPSFTFIRPKQGEKTMSDKLPTDWTLEQARELIEAKGGEWRKEKAREADAKVGDFAARVSEDGEIHMCGIITRIQSDQEAEFCGGHNAGYPESMENQPRTAYKLPQEIMESIKNYLRSRGVEVK